MTTTLKGELVRIHNADVTCERTSTFPTPAPPISPPTPVHEASIESDDFVFQYDVICYYQLIIIIVIEADEAARSALSDKCSSGSHGFLLPNVCLFRFTYFLLINAFRQNWNEITPTWHPATCMYFVSTPCNNLIKSVLNVRLMGRIFDTKLVQFVYSVKVRVLKEYSWSICSTAS